MATDEASKSFDAWLPLEVCKARPGGPKYPIRGIVSTEDEDHDKEEVLQDGLDWSYFLDERGYFNDDHDKTTAGGVGVPTKIERITRPNGRKATAVEGYLLDTERGKAIWDLAEALKRAGNPRTLGFSIQGQIQAREGPATIPWRDPQTGQIHMLGKRIAKAKVIDVAITRHPKNGETSLEALAKSLTACSQDDVAKALSAGAQTPASGGGSGAPLMLQSIGGRVERVVPKAGGTKMKRVKRAAWNALDPEAQDLMKAKGYECEGDDEDEDDKGEMEKSQEVINLEQTIDTLRDSFAKGMDFSVAIYTPGDVEGKASIVRDLLDGEEGEEIAKSLDLHTGTPSPDSLRKGIDADELRGAVEPTTELVKSLQTEIAEIRDAEKTRAAEMQGQIARLTDALEKSNRVPASPRAIREGAPIIPADVDDGENLAQTRYGELSKGLRIAYGSEGDLSKRKAISEFLTAVESSTPANRPVVTRAALKAKNIDLPGL